jgi:ferredoxin
LGGGRVMVEQGLFKLFPCGAILHCTTCLACLKDSLVSGQVLSCHRLTLSTSRYENKVAMVRRRICRPIL